MTGSHEQQGKSRGSERLCGIWLTTHNIRSKEAHVAWNYMCTDTATRPENKREREPLPVPAAPRVMQSSPTPRLVSYSMVGEKKMLARDQHSRKMMTGGHGRAGGRGRAGWLMSELRKHDVVCKKPRFWRVCVCASGAKTCMCASQKVAMFSLPPRSTLRGLDVAALYGGNG